MGIFIAFIALFGTIKAAEGLEKINERNFEKELTRYEIRMTKGYRLGDILPHPGFKENEQGEFVRE